MEKLVCVLDDFVCSLKEISDFKDVRFVHSGRNKPAEKPVMTFLVACGVKSQSVRVLDGGGVSQQGVLEFCVYAPSGESKRTLGILCENMVSALENSPQAEKVQEISIYDAAFDSNLTVWRQTISVVVSASANAGNSGGISLAVCGSDVHGVTSFSVLCNRDYYRVKELLSGDTGERVVTKEDYVITLSARISEDIFAAHPRGGITVLLRATGDEYVDCAVEKSTLKVTPSGVGREYVLISNGRKAG